MTHARLILMNTLVRLVLGGAHYCMPSTNAMGGSTERPIPITCSSPWRPGVRGRNFFVSSLSKSLALTGMRVSYLAGPTVVISSFKGATKPHNIQSQDHCAARAAPISPPY